MSYGFAKLMERHRLVFPALLASYDKVPKQKLFESWSMMLKNDKFYRKNQGLCLDKACDEHMRVSKESTILVSSWEGQY